MTKKLTEIISKYEKEIKNICRSGMKSGNKMQHVKQMQTDEKNFYNTLNDMFVFGLISKTDYEEAFIFCARITCGYIIRMTD